MQEAALDALSSICKDNAQFSQDVVYHSTNTQENVITILFKMIRDRRPAMRLSSATCLSHLHKTGSLSKEFSSKICTVLLPTIIRLFCDTTHICSQFGMTVSTIQERAAALFSYLVMDNADLQAAAVEGDAIPKLALMIVSIRQSENPDFAIQGSSVQIIRSSTNDKLFEVT